MVRDEKLKNTANEMEMSAACNRLIERVCNPSLDSWVVFVKADVCTCERQLRQSAANVQSNAVKWTHRGQFR